MAKSVLYGLGYVLTYFLLLTYSIFELHYGQVLEKIMDKKFLMIPPCVHVGKLILLQHLKVNNFRKMFTNAEHGQSPSAVILLFYGLKTVV